MSYNVDAFKIKKLNELIIPLSALSKNMKIEPIVTNFDTNEVIIEMGDGQIKGILKEGKLHVSKLNIRGEGSGYLMSNVIEPALSESTGELEAILVWEGGDSITRETVINGKYKSEIHEL